MNLASEGFVYIYDSITENARRSFVFIVSRDKSERGNRKYGSENMQQMYVCYLELHLN